MDLTSWHWCKTTAMFPSGSEIWHCKGCTQSHWQGAANLPATTQAVTLRTNPYSLCHLSFKWQKTNPYGLWNCLSSFFSETKITWESRHCIDYWIPTGTLKFTQFPVKDMKTPIKKKCHYSCVPCSSCQTEAGFLTTSTDTHNQDYFWNHLCGTVHTLGCPSWSECYEQLHNLC